MNSNKPAILALAAIVGLFGLTLTVASFYLFDKMSVDRIASELHTTLEYQSELIATAVGPVSGAQLDESQRDTIRHLVKAYNLKQKHRQPYGIKFMAGYREGETLGFLVDLPGYARPETLRLDPGSPFPLVRALYGESGFYSGPDYREQRIYAAYKAMPTLGIGLLAKVDSSRVQAPLLRILAISLLLLALLFALTGWLFVRVARPVLRQFERSLTEHKAVLETAADGILTINAEGAIELFNPQAERIFGYRADEVLGRNVSMLMPEPHQSAHDGYLRHHLETGEEKVIGIGREVQGLRKDGSVFPLDLSVTRMDIEGRPYFTGVTRDISQQKASQQRIRENEARLSFLFAKSPVVIYECSTDRDFACTFVSDNIEELFGYRASDFLQHRRFWAERIHPEDAPRVFGELGKLFEHGHHEHEYRFRLPDGSYCWIEDRLRLIYDEQGEPEDIIGYWVNIDSRKQTEQAIREAKEAAEKASQAKSTFVSSMSHELRTPLNAILGLAELLLHDSKLSPAQQKNIGAINKAGGHLLALINDILDLAKIESGELGIQQEAVSLQDILQECRPLIGPLLEERSIRLDLQLAARDLHVWADRTRLKQILLNLLSNAAKYNKHNGRITVSTGNAHNGRARVTITDTGPGIGQEKQRDLFQPFHRLGAENSNIEGSGIGLYYSKQLLESMGGSIGLESIEDIGSSFWIELDTCEASQPTAPAPLEPSQEISPAAQLYKDTHGQRKRILVAEDNRANQALILQQLQLLDYDADIADDGEQAFERWQQHDYDLLLTDINMPVMDGIRLTTHIRDLEQASGRRSPIIAITANALQSDVEECLSAGMDDHIAKPISLEGLKAILGKWLERTEQQQQAKRDSSARTISTVAAVDPQMLVRLVGKDKEVHRRLLKKFIETAPEIIAAIHAASVDDNSAEVCAQSHKLKSSARSIGANQLADLCQALEQAGKADNLRTIHARVSELEKRLNAVEDYVNVY